jgi:hypothetical protein
MLAATFYSPIQPRWFTRSPYSAELITTIDPVDGWRLFKVEAEDSDGFWYPDWFAARDQQEVLLDVSRFRWSPSQARFAWLVENGFPPRPALGPWDDTDIEARIAGMVLA